MSAATVVRSARHALRRPLFPRAVMAMERQPQRAAEFSGRRFHSSDCTTVGKPAGANKATGCTAGKPAEAANKKAAVEIEDAAVCLMLDRILRSLDGMEKAIIEAVIQQQEEENARRRGMRVLAVGSIVAGVLAYKYVKRRFFGGGDKEEEGNMTAPPGIN